jgi:hypothetical protein
MRLHLAVLALLLLIASGAAHAQSGPTGFQSPSKNIACAYFDYDKQNTLRCDIMEATVTARRPADCDLEWGKAFEMNAKSGATRLCYGDTVMEPKMPVLAYGEAQWIYLHIGANGRDLLQRGSSGVFAIAGEAGIILRQRPLRRHGRA